MSKVPHTPTPWSLIVEGDGDEEMIVRTAIGPNKKAPRNLNEICFFTTGSFDDETENANAEFTIKAVNHHYELRTRLYNLKNAVETTMSVLKCSPEVSMCLIEANETLKKVIE